MALHALRSLLAGLGLLGAAPCVDERRRQVAEAQAKGGCVPASMCDTGTFRVTYPQVCYPSPAERDAVINDIKAAEIEAAILEQLAEEAEKPESSAPEAEHRATDAADKLEAARRALDDAHGAFESHVARADERRAALTRLLAVVRRDRDNLAALQRSIGIA